MQRSSFLVDRSAIRPGMREIQARWTPAVRRERAMEGRRRMQEFLNLVSAKSEPQNGEEAEVWACGALADDDMQRLFGRCG